MLTDTLLFATTTFLIWVALVYSFSALWWLIEVLPLGIGWSSSEMDAWGLDDVQVRVLTIGAEDVVQATVDSVPDSVAGIKVIAEQEIEINGATVHVVPDSFSCDATNKGRAVEWARRHVPCDAEYVLYLDEDTLVTGLTGLPDADFVQFTEKPIFTGSRLAYLCEVFRVGYQFEQRAFRRLSYPLYAWGGGFAIRHELEDELTWDVATITEDTNLIWRAADRFDLEYRLVDARFRNQAPPSLKAMIKQRRRWMSGTLKDNHILPLLYQPLTLTRVVSWGFSPAIPLLIIGASFVPGATVSIQFFELISTALLVVLFIYMLFGLWAYRKHPLLWPVFLVLTPVAVVLHAVGAAWGVISPIEEFEVTEKVAPETVEEVNPELSEGAIAAHDGEDRLVRESADEFDTELFKD
jgi:hypothetical protein